MLPDTFFFFFFFAGLFHWHLTALNWVTEMRSFNFTIYFAAAFSMAAVLSVTAPTADNVGSNEQIFALGEASTRTAVQAAPAPQSIITKKMLSLALLVKQMLGKKYLNCFLMKYLFGNFSW